MIYLDNAATTYPKPDSVLKAINEAMMFYGANPGRGGHKMTLRAGKVVYSTRQAIAEMFSCSSERVIFTSNCTASLNTAIKGTLKKGDHVLISSLEHNSVFRPVHALWEQGVITYDVFYVYPFDNQRTIEEISALIKENTVMLICTAVSNVFGTLLPLDEISEFIKKKDILFAVDGAQAAGSMKIDMKTSGIDLLCIPGHKGLMGPMGTGVLLMNDRVTVNELVSGGTGSNSFDAHQPEIYPDRLESGTVNLPGIAGLKAGIDFVSSIGISQISSYENELITVLMEDLSVIPAVKIYENMYNGKTNLISFNLAGLHSEQVAQSLDKNGIAVRAGYHCSALAHKNYSTEESGTVRVSVGPFNRKKDIKNFSFCLNKIAMCKKV